MYDAPGLGLAAPQVGVQKRLFVYDIGEGPRTLVNPVISEARGEWSYDEGCLSVPGMSFEIIRPKEIHLTGYDLDGNEVSIEADELLARLLPARARPPRWGALARASRRRPAQGGDERASAPSWCGTTGADAEVGGPVDGAAPAVAGAGRIVSLDPPAHPRRLAFLGTPDVAVGPLRALVAAGFEVALVVTRADKRRSRGGAPEPSPVKAAALELGLPVTEPSRRRARCRGGSRRRRRVRSAREAARAGRGADGEPPLLAAAAVARRGPRRASDPRRGPRDRCVSHGGWRRASTPDRCTRACACRSADDRDGRLAAGRARGGGDRSAGRPLSERAWRHPRRRRASPPTPRSSTRPSSSSTGRAPADRARSRRAGRSRVDDISRHAVARARRDAAPLEASPGAGVLRGAIVGTGDGVLELARGAARRTQADAGNRAGSTAPASRTASGSDDNRLTSSTADARAVALEALVRIERDGRLRQPAPPRRARRSDLSDRDRAFATELVYGTLRMRRACDWLIDRFVRHPPDLPTAHGPSPRRVSARVPRHARRTRPWARRSPWRPKHTRPFVNAVLRRVAKAPVEFPDDADEAELSRLDRRAPRRGSRRGRRPRRTRTHGSRATRADAQRRLHPGRGVGVDGGARRRRARACGSPTCARLPAARRRRWRPRAPRCSPPTPARPGCGRCPRTSTRFPA